MAANTGQSAPDDHWLGLLQEDILEPDLPIIDPHHHLWLRNGYTYLMPELAADLASGHNIVATVFAHLGIVGVFWESLPYQLPKHSAVITIFYLVFGSCTLKVFDTNDVTNKDFQSLQCL